MPRKNHVHVLPPETLAAPRNRWDMAVEWMLAALLAFMPLAFGAVEEWSELVVVVAAGVLALIVAVRTAVDRTFRPPWTPAYVPLALFLLLVAFQITPLPKGVVATLSPVTEATRTELLADVDRPASTTTISLYPLATARGLRLVLAAAAIFIVTASVFRTAPQINRLLATVFIIGCAQATLALLQIFTQAEDIYWVIDAGPRALTSGSFVNYSNFSQFMNLSIGAGVAWLLVRMQQEHRKGRQDWASRPFGGARLQPHAPIMAGLIICSLSVLTSMSRNGAISMVAAGSVVAAALYARGTLSRRGWVLAMLPLGAAFLLLLFAFDVVADRLATLRDAGSFADRWQLTLDVLRAWSSFPLWGIGLNAHEYVFPMFDASVVRELAAHADNDYAQLLEEVGLFGALLVAAFVVIIGYRLVRLCRRGRTSLAAAAFGLAFGLLAVALHSASDFGQRIPAVFCLSAITCGLVVQIARLEREAKGGTFKAPALVRMLPARPVAAIGVAGVVMIAGWSLVTGYRAFLGEQWWAMAYQIEDRINRTEREVTDEDYQDLLAASDKSFDLEPGNVNYGYWLNARRWGAMSRNLITSNGQLAVPAEANPIVQRIADELTKVRAICPTFGPPHALEGQLRLLILDDPRGARLIEQGVRLAPYDPPTCLIAGQVAAREGRIDDAQALINRAVALNAAFYRDAVQIYLFDLKRPDLAIELAGGDYARLAHLADVCRETDDYARLAIELNEDAEAALRDRAAGHDAQAVELATLATVEIRRDNHSDAVNLLRRALALDYKQVEWRLWLAQALVETGELEQAAHEAQICLRLRPSHPQALQLIEDIGRQQGHADR
jgi:O-antigen ligase/tetratricopeptide (TPR) repeat protein